MSFSSYLVHVALNMMIIITIVNDSITEYDDFSITKGDPVSETDWNKQAKNTLRAEMTRRGITVKQLAEILGENERGLANKISRGAFTAAFMLQCLNAIGSRSLQLD